MPYREARPVATYALRSSRTIFVVLGLLVVLTLTMLAATLVASSGTLWLSSMLPMLGLLLATLAYVGSLKNHLVAGGAGELRLFEGHLEVPPAWRGATLHLPYESLSLEIRRFETRIYWQRVASVEVLILRSGDTVRELSSRLFDPPERLQHAAEDILALKSGQRPSSHLPRKPTTPKTPDEWDQRIEDELAALD